MWGVLAFSNNSLIEFESCTPSWAAQDKNEEDRIMKNGL